MKAEEVFLEVGTSLGAAIECLILKVFLVMGGMVVVVENFTGNGELLENSVKECFPCELMVLFLLLIMLVVSGLVFIGDGRVLLIPETSFEENDVFLVGDVLLVTLTMSSVSVSCDTKEKGSLSGDGWSATIFLIRCSNSSSLIFSKLSGTDGPASTPQPSPPSAWLDNKLSLSPSGLALSFLPKFTRCNTRGSGLLMNKSRVSSLFSESKEYIFFSLGELLLLLLEESSLSESGYILCNVGRASLRFERIRGSSYHGVVVLNSILE